MIFSPNRTVGQLLPDETGLTAASRSGDAADHAGLSRGVTYSLCSVKYTIALPCANRSLWSG